MPQFTKPQMQLLLLRHARHCNGCSKRYCAASKLILAHIIRCKTPKCPTPFCDSSRILVHHFRHCNDLGCALCVPIRTPVDRCPVPLCTCVPKKRAAPQDSEPSKKRAAPTQDEGAAAEALVSLIP